MSKNLQPQVLQLSSQIPVVLQHQDGGVAATYWWVKVGSADESPEEAGFAHFLEHMLFKDAAAKETGQASTGQTASAIESLGGDINAYTTFDQTVYHVTCAAQHWEKVIDIFGTMAKPQRFLASDFSREREVILEELRRSNDSPERQLYQELFSRVFSGHPYAKPVIGFEKILKSARLPGLEAFYKRNYAAHNMGIILVGPVLDDQNHLRPELKKLVEKHFGEKVFPKKTADKIAAEQKPRATGTKKTGFQIQKLGFDVKSPTLVMGVRTPGLSHSDMPALDMLSSVLGTGETSRCYQTLFQDRALVTSISGGLYVPGDLGVLYFQMELDEASKIVPAAEAMIAEFEKIQSSLPTAQELSRIVVNAESEKLYSTQSVDGVAGRLGYLKFTVGDLGYDRVYVDQLKALKAEDLVRVARKYFARENWVVLAQLPKDQKAAFNLQPLTKAFQKLPVKKRAPAPQTKSKQPASSMLLERSTTSQGLKSVYHRSVGSPVFSVHASVLGGARLESAEEWGLSQLLAELWTQGTKTKSAQQIAEITEGMAASIEGYAGRNTMGLQLTGLVRDWDLLSKLFIEIISEPQFPDEEWTHAIRTTEDSIRTLEDHSSRLCSKLFLETLYENHPYGRLMSGSLEQLAKLNVQKLKNFYSKTIRVPNLCLAFSGDLPRNLFETFVTDIELALPKAATNGMTSPLSEFVLKAPRWVDRKLGREQVHALVGGLGTTLKSSDRYAVRMLENVLGGQSGRLFIELREKKSLAYSIAPMNVEGVEPGYLANYIGCAPNKVDEAILGIKKVLEELSKKGPTKKELKRAQEYYLGRRAMDRQGETSLAAYLGLNALYDLPHTSDAEVAAQVFSVTAGDIKDACKKYLVKPYQVTSLVG